MNRRMTAIVERDGDGYVALCPEVDVASQGETVAEARENLAEALASAACCGARIEEPAATIDR